MRLPVQRFAFHPVLLAGYFVLFLYAANVQLVRTSEVVGPLAWAIAGSLLLLGVCALLLRDIGRGAIVASALVVAFMGYGHVAGLAGEETPRELLIGGWTVFLAGAVALALYRRTPIAALTGGLNITAIVLIVFALSAIVPHQLHAPARAQPTELEPTGLTAQRTTQRDIYYLVFDRYGSHSSLEAEFGITDNALPDWLAERGFTVLPGARANYSRTTLSMASTLNMEYLDEVAAQMGPDSTDHGPIYTKLQDHLVGRFLGEQGYRYIHIGSWFGPTRTARVADENLEAESATEFEAVFYETTAMPLIDEHVRGPEEFIPPSDLGHREHALFQFRALHRVAGDPGPKFVLAHVLLPHEPYVFDADGSYISQADRANDPVALKFRRQLEFTNSQIKAYIERLLAGPPDRQPIIVVGADEGPHPQRYGADWQNFDWGTATPAELEAKFGIITALYMPPEPDQPADLPEPYDTMSAVNTFRLIFGHYFGLELPYLPDRMYTPRNPTYVYDLTEITHRLPPH